MGILLGPTCSGKTTLGHGLAKQLDLPHLVGSALLRYVHSNAVEASDALQVETIMVRLRRPDCSHGFILDNFPRNGVQAAMLEDALRQQFGSGVSHVFDLEVPIKVLESRAAARLVHRDTGLPIQNLEEFQDVGGDKGNQALTHSGRSLSMPHGVQQEMLVRRSDDAPEKLHHRLQRYGENIAALRNYYRSTYSMYKVLDGPQSENEVLAQALRDLHSGSGNSLCVIPCIFKSRKRKYLQ